MVALLLRELPLLPELPEVLASIGMLPLFAGVTASWAGIGAGIDRYIDSSFVIRLIWLMLVLYSVI